MDNSIAQRFKKVRKENNLTQNEFAETLGISRTLAATIERGVKEINTQTIKKLHEEFNISSDWLLFGVGQMSDPENNLQEKFAAAYEYNKLLSPYYEALEELRPENKDRDSTGYFDTVKYIDGVFELDNELPWLNLKRMMLAHQNTIIEALVRKKGILHLQDKVSDYSSLVERVGIPFFFVLEPHIKKYSHSIISDLVKEVYDK
ncbi:MAG: helix-turn-helix domain-containing protein [Carboxylicivirga sp.]|jgi:transcriptional regulator with XRE-family HTH domain|nr:helix-turn-helix domain-containing protein [Carboxylicivirga sp.]